MHQSQKLVPAQEPCAPLQQCPHPQFLFCSQRRKLSFWESPLLHVGEELLPWFVGNVLTSGFVLWLRKPLPKNALVVG